MSGIRLFDLNPEQYRAAVHGDGPLLILAGAGSGKTRVITARIAWLLHSGIAPENILAVTFTNKAAREMQERTERAVGRDKARTLTLSTFHSLCVRILRQHAHFLGYKSNFTIYDDSDQTGLLKKIIARTAAKDEKLDPQLARNLISRAKNMGTSPPQNDETLIGAVYARYVRELKNLNAMDFDDLLGNTVKLLSEHAEARTFWQSRYTHILIDEFQDTNRLQLELATLLVGNQPNICVVGDDDQSIYGWRGAEISNILEFEHHFPEPTIVRLEQNYRSTKIILDAANRLIQHNPQRRGKKLWSASPGGDPIRLVMAPDDRQEADFVAGELLRRQAEASLSWEDFAVLFRMNAQSRLIEGALRHFKIPYRIIGGKSFFDRREIKDLLAYANFLLNPDDDISLLRMIRAPGRGIGDTTLDQALQHSIREKCSLFESLTSNAFLATCGQKIASAIRIFREEWNSCHQALSLTPSHQAALFTDYFKNSGYLDYLRRSCKSKEEADGREENIHELLKSLSDYPKIASLGLRGFIDSVSLDREREEEKDSGHGVTLITMHAAKGLEFPHVYLLGAEDGILPHERSKTEGTIPEERRLMYVGITRAMRSLTITHCASRVRYGSAMHCRPSPFLEEITGEDVVSTSTTEILNQPATDEDATAAFSRFRALHAENAASRRQEP